MAKDLIVDGKLQGPLDCAGCRLLNLDTSNLSFNQGPVGAHQFYVGPTSGVAVPTFRAVTADEIQAQPTHANLSAISASTLPTAGGLQLLSAAVAVTSYLKLGLAGLSYQPVASVLADIGAQAANASLNTLSNKTIGPSGLSLLALSPPGVDSYAFVKADGTVSLQSPATVVGILGVGLPFADNVSLIKNAAAPTKTFKISAALITAGQSRTMTVPDYDFTVCSLLGSERMRNHIYSGLTFITGTAPDFTTPPTYNDNPVGASQFGLVAVGATLISVSLRATGAVDAGLPTTGIICADVGVPASASAAGTAGQTAYDASFNYRCVATNTWKRAALSTW